MDQNQYQKRLAQLEHLVQEVDKSRQFWQISSTQAKERASIAELRLKSIENLCVAVEGHPDRRTVLSELVVAISAIRETAAAIPNAVIAYDIWDHIGQVATRMSDGWVPFGWHANYSPCPELEFDRNDLDDAGDPKWERRLGAFDPDDKFTLLGDMPMFLSMKPGNFGSLDE